MEALSKNKIKFIRSLRSKKHRLIERCFVVEGEKMVHELLEQHKGLVDFVCTTDPESDFSVSTFLTDETGMKQIAAHKTPPSLLAVVQFPEPQKGSSGITLILDGIQDPGNLGTIIRTADWFNVDRIVCSNETVDCFNPKVIQSCMGSIFRVPIEYTILTDFIQRTNLPIYGALLEGNDLYQSKLQVPSALIIGNEGNGISEEVQLLIDHPVFIPRYGEAESLNAAIATGILLAEFNR